MKGKLIALIVLALGLAATATAQKSLKMELKVDRTAAIEKALSANETAAWKLLVDKKYDDFGKFVADDYQGIYDFETTTKASELSEAKQSDFKSAVVSDVKVKVLDENNAIVTSTVKFEMVTPDGQNVADNVRTTSFWVKRGGGWLIVYHSHISIKQ